MELKKRNNTNIMQIHDLKLKKAKKKRKTIGRGGKKGTYSGRGNKGQKARSGGNVNPLFEGGRSTLVDHMKKKRGFKALDKKKNVVSIAEIVKKFPKGGTIDKETLIASGFITKNKMVNGVKILGKAEIKQKFSIAKEILLSASVRDAITKAGGEIAS